MGRARELEALQAAWDRVLREQRCELVTLVGEAGVGKSRLGSGRSPFESWADLDAVAAKLTPRYRPMVI